MAVSASTRIVSIAAFSLLFFGIFAFIGNPAFAVGERGALVRVANIYLSPDTSSAKLAEIERGRELVILESTRDWVHVEALLGPEKTVTGWILDKGLVRSTNPDGDKILFGEAADSEDEASRRHGRRGADQDALRLYYRVYDFFPASPIAGEALYRAADIRWQLERAEVMSRPSARERDPMLREGMDEEWMKQVTKKFPGTKWADLAAFHMIENKLCGEWQGSSKCPEKEAELYEKYANERPQSPAAAQALYFAASRRAALIDIYKTEEQKKKAEESRAKALALTQKAVQQYPQSDWATRAQGLMFLVQQNVATFGNAVE
jgi:tetratricopeptide (TPR) repeat protein